MFLNLARPRRSRVDAGSSITTFRIEDDQRIRHAEWQHTISIVVGSQTKRKVCKNRGWCFSCDSADAGRFLPGLSVPDDYPNPILWPERHRRINRHRMIGIKLQLELLAN